MKNISGYLTVKKAAKFLGVTPSTLRNWTKYSKIKSHKNPINGYRLYCVEDLEELLITIQFSSKPILSKKSKIFNEAKLVAKYRNQKLTIEQISILTGLTKSKIETRLKVAEEKGLLK